MLASLLGWTTIATALVSGQSLPGHATHASESQPTTPQVIASDESALVAELLQRVERLEAENGRLALSETADSDRTSILPIGYWLDNQRHPGHGTNSTFPTLELSGFVQLDAGWASQSNSNRAAVGDVESKVGLRRTRLRATGRVRDDVSYTIDLDFSASGHPSFRDVMFAAHNQPLIQNVKIGYFQQPFGLEALTSGRELLLLERQLPFAFAPFRQTGIATYGTAADERMTWAISGYRYPTDSFGVSQGDSGGWGYAHRFTALPVAADGDTFVHLGTSFSFINPGTNEVRYAIEPGFFVIDPVDQGGTLPIPAFVDTGPIAATGVNLFGFEIAAQRGPLHAEAEFISSFVDQPTGSDLAFFGVSTKLSCVLTGEAHPYDKQQGVFTRIVPEDEGVFLNPLAGAYEAVLGWSMIDLNSGPVQGGELQTLIAGINRYANSYTKYQLNVIHALLDDPNAGRSNATLVVLRAQVEF